MEPAPPILSPPLSYEDQSNNYVYFDDFKVTHTKSNLIQGNEYYPYGLQTANSWTRENNTGNNFLYNGGTELNQTTQVYDLYYRNYDPVLGRFGQVDPMAGFYSGLTPYHYSNDDPVAFNDPLGDCPDCGSFEDRFNVMRGPHDTGNMFRVYRYSDPTGGMRANWLYSTMMEKGYTVDNGAEVYNKWCGCLVSAFEVVMETNPNQNQEYRRRAIGALLAAKARQDRERAKKNNENSSSAPTWSETATGISIVLLADDATVVGTIDDVLIPFLLAAAYLMDEMKTGYQGPLVETVPDKTDPFYNINSNYNFNNGGPPGNVDPTKLGLAAGSVMTILRLINDKKNRQQFMKEQQEKSNPKPDATKFIIPLKPR